MPFRYNCSLGYHEASPLTDVFGTKSCVRWCSIARQLSEMKNWVNLDSFDFLLSYLTDLRALEPASHWSIIFVSFCSRTCRSKRTACFPHLLLFPHPTDREGMHSQVPNWTKRNSQTKPPPSSILHVCLWRSIWMNYIVGFPLSSFSVDYIWKAFWKRYFYFV